jgi:hypothetical protein
MTSQCILAVITYEELDRLARSAPSMLLRISQMLALASMRKLKSMTKG